MYYAAEKINKQPKSRLAVSNGPVAPLAGGIQINMGQFLVRFCVRVYRAHTVRRKPSTSPPDHRPRPHNQRFGATLTYIYIIICTHIYTCVYIYIYYICVCVCARDVYPFHLYDNANNWHRTPLGHLSDTRYGVRIRNALLVHLFDVNSDWFSSLRIHARAHARTHPYPHTHTHTRTHVHE